MKQGSYQVFNSKIMLFGEYSLIYGSKALSIPFQNFNGKFIKNPAFEIDENQRVSNYYLKQFTEYIEKLPTTGNGDYRIDIDKFRNDISKGLVFQSDIPQGYGLGSSGALVAAVYSAYGNLEPIDPENLAELFIFKNFLAKMESCFHGKSSGLDPLISFLNKPVLIEGKDQLSLPGLPDRSDNLPGAMFLIDSGQAGETQPLVDMFIGRCCDKKYLELIQSKYNPLVNASISAYVENRSELLFEKLKLLSSFQLNHFIDMIPQGIQAIWKHGLDSGGFSLKLCGSGGGGMMLGFTTDFNRLSQVLSGQKITFVHPL